MLIYGWGSYNKSDWIATRGRCEACGKAAYMRSYDTWRFFHLWFIPILPLGRKHVLRECPGCEQGRWTSRGEWARLRRAEVDPVVAAVADGAGDEAALHKALEMTAGLDVRDRFYEVALAIEQRKDASADLLARLGGAYGHFLMHDAARRSLRRALERDPGHVDAHRQLALQAFDDGKPDEATDHVEVVLAAEGAEAMGLGLLQVETYQSLGRHDDATALLDRLEARFPEAEKEAVALFRRQSEGLRTPTQRVRLGNVLAGIRPPEPPNRLFQLAPVLLVPGAAAIALLAIVMASALARAPVYLVNGLDRPYDVLVDGERVRIGAATGQPQRLSIAPGRVRIEPAPGEKVVIAPCELDVSAGVFDDSIYVVNPDALALLMRVQVIYDRGGNREPDVQLVTGQQSYAFDDVDFPFREPPQTITSKSKGPFTRLCLQQLQAATLADRVGAVAVKLGQPEIAPYLRRRLEAQPDDAETLGYLAYFTSAAEMAELLRPGLAARPVRVEWHRSYQSAVEAAEPGRDLRAEYAALLAAEPDDRALAYLTGRVCADPDEALRYYERALEPPGCAHAHMALAWVALAAGDGDAALERARAALALDPDSLPFQAIEDEALLCAERLDEVLARVARRHDEHPTSTGLLADRVRLLIRLGRDDEAKNLVARVANQAGDEAGMADRAAAVAAVQSHAAIAFAEARADADGFVAAAQSTTDPLRRFQALLVTGNLGQASAMLALPDAGGEPPEDAVAAMPQHHLLLFALADRAGDVALARRHHEAAVAGLRAAPTPEERRLADLLAAETAPGELDLRTLPHDNTTRLLALVAVGQRFAPHREACFGLARRLSYRREFPHLLVARLLESD